MISEIYNKAEILTHLVIFCDTTRIDKKKKGVPIYTWFPGPRGLKWCFSLGANSTDTNRLNIVYKGENESLEKILCIDNTSYFNLIPSKTPKSSTKTNIFYIGHICVWKSMQCLSLPAGNGKHWKLKCSKIFNY